MRSSVEKEKAYSRLMDLEAAICDLDRMADLAATYIGDLLGQSLQSKLAPPEGQAETAQFCVYHLNKLTGQLRAAFYAAVEQGDAS